MGSRNLLKEEDIRWEKEGKNRRFGSERICKNRPWLLPWFVRGTHGGAPDADSLTSPSIETHTGSTANVIQSILPSSLHGHDSIPGSNNLLIGHQTITTRNSSSWHQRLKDLQQGEVAAGLIHLHPFHPPRLPILQRPRNGTSMSMTSWQRNQSYHRQDTVPDQLHPSRCQRHPFRLQWKWSTHTLLVDRPHRENKPTM